MYNLPLKDIPILFRFTVAVAWSVPWSQIAHDNTLAVGLPPSASDATFNNMYYGGTESWFSRNTYTQDGVHEVKACNRWVCIEGEYFHDLAFKIITFLKL